MKEPKSGVTVDYLPHEVQILSWAFGVASEILLKARMKGEIPPGMDPDPEELDKFTADFTRMFITIVELVHDGGWCSDVNCEYDKHQ